MTDGYDLNKKQCRKCGSTESIILPSSGHTDLNHDGICEVCFKQIEGNDPEPVHYNIGDVQARRIKGKIYLFRCIDEDYGKKHYFSVIARFALI